MRHTFVVCVNSISPIATGCFISVNMLHFIYVICYLLHVMCYICYMLFVIC